MRLGLKLFLATVLAAALVVPAAGAKPGGGNGNGGGKPAWAGQQSSQGGNGGGKASAGARAKGKPDWAGQGRATGQAKKAERAQLKLERRAAAAETEEPAEGEEQEGPLKDNPAFTCKFERDMMGDEAFAAAYGENENQANAFGKCVSQEAHERDGAGGDGEEAAEEAAEEPPSCEPVEGEEAVDGEEPVAGEEPVEGEEPAEGRCPDEEGSGSGDEAGDETGEDSGDEAEDGDGSSTEEIVAAVRLLL
jgi:hypothetical protein